jgi:general stress protein YciG
MAGVGKGWHGDPEGHARAGQKGGEIVSRNREHMAAIGRKGGQLSGGNFAHNPERAREAGRKGGQASRGNQPASL